VTESTEESISTVFRAQYAERNRPERIVTFWPYLRVAQTLETTGMLRDAREVRAAYGTQQVDESRAALDHTKLILALNKGRKWARERFVRWLDPLLEEEIAIAVVPSHDPFNTEAPIRQLAQSLVAANAKRIDATGVLVRHQAIKRIVFGGPSYNGLHRETIRVESADLIRSRRVLLLDDIAKSGASLRACRDLLYEAGATTVQAVALGRVTEG